MAGAVAALGKIVSKSDGLVKGALKYGDDIVEGVAKYGDDVASALAKNSDEALDAIQGVTKNSDEALVAIQGITKNSDEAMENATKCIKGNKCFVAGTLVLTTDGYKEIQDVKKGDKVIATDPETGETAIKEVVETYVNETDELIHLTVNGEEIITTPTHMFFAPQRGWTQAIDLRAGDILVLVNGEYVIVEKTQHEILEEPVKVYNFQVEDFHTYYVGEQGVLVHNECPVDTLGEGATGTKDIYRAVDLDEFNDIFETRGFRPKSDGRSLQAKEFGNSFDETLNFADQSINIDKVAIVKVTIPENIYNQLNHMNLDSTIFKSGTPVVEPEMLEAFNKSIISIEHAF